ncbi:MAG: DNA-binding protein HU [Mycoplasmataceae bacterium RC_NB112A]|nr:MAG: DNA-binding protein HU [Mycoplasmataceae bacterium RC_NB112A]
MVTKVQKKNKINNLNHIVEEVQQRTDYSKGQVKKIASELLNVIGEKIVKGESVNFIGLFSFSTRKQAAKKMIMRFGKNKGKEVKIPAKTIPTFKYSTAFKKRVKEG